MYIFAVALHGNIKTGEHLCVSDCMLGEGEGQTHLSIYRSMGRFC